MKKTGLFRRFIGVILALTMTLGMGAVFAGCGEIYSVKVTLMDTNIAVGGTTKVIVAIAGTDNEGYTLSSSDETVAIVSADGTVTGLSDGKVEIIATASVDGKTTGKATLVVGTGSSNKDDSPYKVKVTLLDSNIAVGGKTKAIVAIAGTDDEEYTLSSSNTSVATVAADGTVSGISSGTADIIATAHVDGKSTGKATVIVGTGKPVNPGETTEPVKITIALVSGNKDRLSEVGETTKVTATVTGADDKTYTFSVTNSKTSDKTEYVTVDAQGNVTVKALPTGIDAFVTVTATSNADPRKTASLSIRVEAPTVEGQVGKLTSDALKAAGNASVTFTGTIKDIYDDLSADVNDWQNVYNTKVEMEDGKWKSTWSIAGESQHQNEMTTLYMKNDDTVKLPASENYENTSGNSFASVYINKNNEVARKTVVDYRGIPVLWQNQYMFNILGKLNVNDFETVADDENLYKFAPKTMSEYEKALLMVRLGVSTTPILSGDDVFSAFYVEVDNDGKVVALEANTEMFYDTGDASTATARSWTEVHINVQNVGTTTISDPAPFAAPDHADVLTAALNKMKAATSYYFEAVDTTTRAPQGDAGDYEYDDYYDYSTPAAIMKDRPAVALDTIWGNRITSAGTTGEKGWVVMDEAIVTETVSKYTYTENGNDTIYEYNGYRQFDGYYEKFTWDTVNKSFKGAQRVANKTLADVVPGFDFSANVFEYVGTNGTNYTFKLRSDEIMATVAKEVSMYNYASDAEASTSRSFTIVVNANGVVSTEYPYNISDNYFGYVTTTYRAVNSTELPKLKTSNDAEETDLFAGYQPRVIPTSWAQMPVVYYHPDHDTRSNYVDIDAMSAFEASFPNSNVNAIPTPDVWLWGVFGDIFDASRAGRDYSGPFFGWHDKEFDDEGNAIAYYDEYAFTCRIENEASFPSDDELDAIRVSLAEALAPSGFVFAPGRSGKTSEYAGVGYRYIVFENVDAKLEIVVENNYTNNFWINIYELGFFSRQVLA